MDAQKFANGEYLQEEITAWRGTPDQILIRIRERYNFTEEDITEELIFEFCLCKYHSRPQADAARQAKQDYANFVAGKRTSLPYYVVRAGDPDVDYTKHGAL